MSTICGIYNIRDHAPSRSDSTKMMAVLTAFPHDAESTWSNRCTFFGNTNSHITPESHYEELPRFNDCAGLAITADAIIDNREELLSAFNIADKEAALTPDSELIIQAYIRWGSECPKYLVGDYAFAIWDENQETLFCARDHVGKRTLYYCHDSEKFAFCTLIKPLLFREEQGELNEEWIADFLATSVPLNQLDTRSTVYRDIFQLPPAHTIQVTKKGIKIKEYWNPLKIPKLKLDSDEAYEEAFRKVFFEAVSCRLRSKGSVGIMLSSGLDSGSIACIASPMLKQQGKTLKSYTSVPFKEYKDWADKSALADERDYVKFILNQYDNIEPNFCDSGGINSYNSLDRLTSLLECPFKYSQNFFWLDNIALLARADGCTVLLDGQSGNYTVSFGDITSYVMSMISKGKWLAAVKEARYYSAVNNRNYNSVLKALFISSLPKAIIQAIRLLLKRENSAKDESPKGLINPSFASLWKVDRKLRKFKVGKYAKTNSTIKDVHRFTASALLFSQAAEAETKLAVKYGIVKRDPTRDKRVVELCLSLPEEQLVSKGVERSIIKRAMKDILPDKIRLNNSVRGLQSADWVQRMKADWSQIKSEFLEAMENDTIKKYVDKDYALSLLEGIDEPLSYDEHGKLQMIMNIISLKRFICKNY